MKTKLNVISAFAGLMLMFFSACSKSDGNTQPPGGNNTANIDITGLTFPATTTVAKGTTVTWYNADVMPHTVTSDDGSSFDSGNLASKATFAYKANTVGTFPYHCNYHSGMVGTLVVTQ
jgi:plastocyanin